ncbi:MAG: response regulator [Steroidobacteraceae bacterium]|jgi:FixJ family two-component response regulator
MNRATDAASHADCLVIDISLPGISGLDLHQQLVQTGVSCPAIFITAHANATTCLNLYKAG